MSDALERALSYARDRRAATVEQLGEWLGIPSISTDPAHRDDMRRAAQWLTGHLKRLGFDNVRLLPPESHPLVWAEDLKAGPDAPTILIYGHYDVQPVDPVELWKTGPFTAAVRDDYLYARGATDMKGQVMAVVAALEAILDADPLPVNVKLMIEGQEEIGSPDLEDFLQSHRDFVASDVSLNPDCGSLAPDLPTITYSMRGIAYFELRLQGPATDLHSGEYGGVVHNPAQVLCDLIAGLHDDDGRVTLAGFYDDVRELDAEEHADLARLPHDDAHYLEQTGAPALWGERGYSPVERIGARPTLEIHGLESGFTDEGAKTVIPCRAMAKLSCRLVPDQDPSRVREQLEAYLRTKAPPSVSWELIEIHRSSPSISDRRSPWIRAMARAQEATFGRPPLFRRGGGGIAAVCHLKTIGIESVKVGWALPGDNMHAPNERLHLPTFHRGIETVIRYLFELRNRGPEGSEDGRRSPQVVAS